MVIPQLLGSTTTDRVWSLPTGHQVLGPEMTLVASDIWGRVPDVDMAKSPWNSSLFYGKISILFSKIDVGVSESQQDVIKLP